MPRKNKATATKYKVIFAVGFDGTPVLVDVPFKALYMSFKIPESDLGEVKAQLDNTKNQTRILRDNLCGNSTDIMLNCCSNIPDKPGIYSATAIDDNQGEGGSVKLTNVKRFSKLYRTQFSTKEYIRPS